MSLDGSLVLVGLLFVVLGSFFLWKLRGETGESGVWLFKTKSPGIGVMLLGGSMMVPGLAGVGAKEANKLPTSDSRPSTEAVSPPAIATRVNANVGNSDVERRCCMTDCRSGAACIPCDVASVSWRVVVSGLGRQEKYKPVVDLGQDPDFGNAQICVSAAGQDADSCVPLTLAVRNGGAIVPGLAAMSADQLRYVGLHLRIVKSRGGELLADFPKRLVVSPRDACKGYRLVDDAVSSHFVSIFLLPAE